MSGDKGSISLRVVKSLLQVQESAFRVMVEMMFKGLRDDIKEICSDVAALQSSLEFSQEISHQLNHNFMLQKTS